MRNFLYTGSTALLALVMQAATATAQTGIRFHPKHHQYTKCVDVRDGVFRNGQAVQIWDCNGSAAQNWEIRRHNYSPKVLTTIVIRDPSNNKEYCLDGSDPNPPDGTHLKIWECTSQGGFPHPNQWFNPTGTYVEYENRNPADDWKCMDMTYGEVHNGNHLSIYKCLNNNDNQYWHY